MDKHSLDFQLGNGNSKASKKFIKFLKFFSTVHSVNRMKFNRTVYKLREF